MRYPSTSPGRISGGDTAGTDSAAAADAEEDEERRATGGGSSPEPPETDPAPDPTPDDIQRTDPGPASPPDPDPEPPDTGSAPDPTPDDIQRTDPAPPAPPDPEPPDAGGSPDPTPDDIQRRDPGPTSPPDPTPDPSPPDVTPGNPSDATTTDQTPDPSPPDVTPGNPSEATEQGGPVDNVGETVSDGLDRAVETGTGDPTTSPVGNALGGASDALFGVDSPDRGVVGDARDRLDGVADRFDSEIADPLREDRGTPTSSPAPGVGGVGAAANSQFVRDSAAQTAELLNPARVGSDLLGLASGAAQGADFLVDEDGALGETADATVDAAQATPGAAVDAGQFVAENPRDAAVTGTALFASLGAGAAAGAATRGAARGARRLAPDGDTLDDFASANRGQLQRGGQRSPDKDTNGRGDVIGGEDIDPRQAQPDQGPSAFPDPLDRFDGGGGFSRGSPDRGTVDDNPASVDPSGGGDGLGFRSAASEVETAQTPPRVDSPTRADLRDVSEFDAPATGSGARFRGADAAAGGGAAGAGATDGAAPLGSISDAADPTGIATTFGPAGTTVDDVNDPSEIGSPSVTATQSVDPASDPTAIDPGSLGFGDQRLGGGLLPGDATGGDSDTGTLDETNDPTNVAPPATNNRTGSDTDDVLDVGGGAGSGTDAGPDVDIGPGSETGSDTDQTPGQTTPPANTPAPPVLETPPVVETPPPNRPPSRPPAPPRRRSPPRRRPRRPPEPDEEERDRQRQRETEPQERFGVFETVDTGAPASSFFSETVTAFGLGAFAGGRGPAEGTAGEFIGGGPTQAVVGAEGDDAEAVDRARGLFFAPALSVGDGGGDTDDAGGLLGGFGGFDLGFGGGGGG